MRGLTSNPEFKFEHGWVITSHICGQAPVPLSIFRSNWNSMKIQNALVSNILDRSQRYFAHVTTVTLSWRVQNIVVIGRVYFTLECFELLSNFEFDRNMLSGTGAWSGLGHYDKASTATHSTDHRLLTGGCHCSCGGSVSVTHVDNFDARMRRLIYSFRETLNALENRLVICLMNSVAWSSSESRRN